MIRVEKVTSEHKSITCSSCNSIDEVQAIQLGVSKQHTQAFLLCGKCRFMLKQLIKDVDDPRMKDQAEWTQGIDIRI